MSSYPEEYRARRPNGDAAPSPREFEEGRQRVLDRLTDAFAADRVSLEDYESRVVAVQRARAPDELAGLVADLPEEPPKGAAPAGRRSAEPRRQDRSEPSVALRNDIDPGLAGSESVACVMSDRNLQGDWLTGDKVDSFTLMGSTKFDFRDTTLPRGRVKIDAFCLMGDVKIIVPRGLPVKMTAFPFMADARVAHNVSRRIVPGEPYLEISGFVMMGDIQVSAAD